MDDLVSRQWVIDHLFFEIDKELVRRAPSAETKVYDDMEACLDTAVCPVNGGPCCHCLPGHNPPCAANIEREEEHHEQGHYPGEPDR